MSARLTAYLPEGAAEQYLLRAPATVVVGRADDCQLVLTHASVSRHHAELSPGPGGWRLRDLDSKNGCFVEGVPARDQVLPRRAWLRFGDVACEFEPLDADALARAEQSPARRREASLALTQRAEREAALPGLLESTLSAIVELAGCERGFLLLKGTDGLDVRAWHGLSADGLRAPAFAGSAGAIQRALETQAPVVVNDASLDAALGARASVVSAGLRTLVCLPLRLGGELLGLAYADSRQPGCVVTRLDLELLAAFAERAALWIAARRSESLLRAAAPALSWPVVAAAHGQGHA